MFGSNRNVVRSRRNPKDACDLSSRHELLTEVDAHCHPGELISVFDNRKERLCYFLIIFYLLLQVCWRLLRVAHMLDWLTKFSL
jgi:hypothetical protein